MKIDMEQQPHINNLPLEGVDNEKLMKAEGIDVRDNDDQILLTGTCRQPKLPRSIGIVS